MWALLGVAWGFGIKVSPPDLRLEAAPGSVVGQVLTVENTSGGPLEARVSVGDLWYGPDGRVFLPAGAHERSLAPTTRVGPEVFLLQQGERRELQLDVRVPPDASGGRYAVVFVEVRGTVADDVKAALRMTSLVMLDAGGVPAPRLVAGEASARQVDGQTLLGLPVTLDGDVHRFAVLKGVVRQESGGRVIREESAPLRLLPGETRALELKVATPLDPGAWRFDGVLTAEGSAPVQVSHRFAVP